MSKRVPIFIGLMLMCLAVWLLVTPLKPVRHFVERLDHLGYDFQLRARVLTRPPVLDSPVAIIDIDDKSISAIGRWPWPRSRLAELVDKLQSQGVVVIAFDIFFPEKQDNIAETLVNTLAKKKLMSEAVRAAIEDHVSLFDEDQTFAKSIQNNQVVLAYGFLPRPEKHNMLPPPLLKLSPQQVKDLDMVAEPGYIGNLPSLQQVAKGGGFVNIFPDEDGIVRRAPLLIEHQGAVYPALSLQAVLTYLGAEAKLITPYYHDEMVIEGVQVGSQVIPLDSRGFVLIPFIGRSYTFPYYSAINVLQGKIPKDALLGKIVFVGTSATGLGDLQPTSIQNPFPGVEIQATLVDGILMNHFSYMPAWTLGANVILTIFFGLLAAFIFPRLGPRVLAVSILVFPLGLLYLNNIVWNKTGLILSILMPVVLVLVVAIFNILYGYVFETRRREQLKEMFGQYVPETHIDEMLKSRDKFNLHGEDKEMSVLFADIRNFTTISEGMSATDLVDMLNNYFTPMTEIIHKHVGTVDKYIGDLIMAFWGAPLNDKKHAYHAMLAALQMQEQLRQMRQLIETKKWPEISMGMGINSGVMSVGDMGSRFRRNYTVLGDAVNLASRVEGLTKYYGVNILVTENTQRDQPKLIFRKIDKVKVKGKKTGVAIYELVGLQAEVTPSVLQEIDNYHKALELYYLRQWEAATVAFKQLQQEDTEKKIYSIYLARIAEYQTNPPPADWDGTHTHLSK
jgi:adenylate cyclase